MEGVKRALRYLSHKSKIVCNQAKISEMSKLGGRAVDPRLYLGSPLDLVAQVLIQSRVPFHNNVFHPKQTWLVEKNIKKHISTKQNPLRLSAEDSTLNICDSCLVHMKMQQGNSTNFLPQMKIGVSTFKDKGILLSQNCVFNQFFGRLMGMEKERFLRPTNMLRGKFNKSSAGGILSCYQT